MFCDNEAVCNNTITPGYFLNNNNHSISYHRCREAVADNTIRFSKQVTENNISDMFTEIMIEARRGLLLDKFT